MDKPKYPNHLRKYLRGYKVARLARDTDIPVRTLWDILAERARIPDEKLDILAACLRCKPEQLTAGETFTLWNVPYQRNPFFTGREDILRQIQKALHKNSMAGVTPLLALCGLGGVGKTQSVLEYAYHHRDEYQAVFWVKSDTYENLLSDFLSLAALLNLPEQDARDQTVTLTAIKRWMQDQAAWLLIFDNADDLTLIREFIPPGYRGHILLTTRAQSMGRLAQHIEVDIMSPEVGTLFLLRRTSIIASDATKEQASTPDWDRAQEIVRELGGLPLALDQAGAYMEEASISLKDYLTLYRKQRKTLLSRRGGLLADHPEPVTTTWSLSFMQVQQTNPAAADLLHICAFLDPDAIPEEIITTGARYLGSALQAIAPDPFLLNQAIEMLRKFSLLRRNPAANMLTIHRLIQASIQDAMDQEMHRVWATRTIQAVHAVFPVEVTVGLWECCQRLLPHVQMCSMLVEQYSLTLTEAATLFNQAGYYLRERALYAEAESLYQKALVIREQIFGPNHPDTAQVLYNLARLYFDLGQYAKCEVLYLRALAIREQTLPSDHLDIALCLNSLAFLYHLWEIEGKYDKAKKLFQWALGIFDRAVGMDHPKTAHCLSNLALLYATEGKYVEAEQMLLRVQAIREKLLGHLHIDTARSLQNLAWLYIHQGKRLDEARKLLEDSLEIRETLLGSEHPQTANSLYHLATLYEACEQYSLSEQLYERVLAVRRKMMGNDNPKVLLTEERLAILLRKMGQHEKAAQLEAHIQAAQGFTL